MIIKRRHQTFLVGLIVLAILFFRKIFDPPVALDDDGKNVEFQVSIFKLKTPSISISTNETTRLQTKDQKSQSSLSERHKSIECKINGDVRRNIGLPEKRQSLHCLLDEKDSEVYVPFKFIKQYFDVRPLEFR